MILSKYIEIGKIYVKARLVWRADIVINLAFTVTKMLFAVLLWGTIFGSRKEVAGFTFHSMLSYYIISSFLGQLEMSSGISSEISTKIRNGTFSKYMILPVNMEKYFVAMEAGIVLFYLAFDLLGAILWVFLFRIKIIFTTSLLVLSGALFMVLLGLLFMVQLNYYLGLLTLKYQDIWMFLMIKDHLVAFVTGSIVPLVLLPESVVSVMKLFPFYYVTYLPAMLLIGREREKIGLGILTLLLWCIFIQVLIGRTWEKYRKKYDGVGI